MNSILHFQFRSLRAGVARLAMPLTLLLTLALTLVACDQKNISELVPGESTQAQVYEKFGQPKKEWQGENGERILEFSRQPAGHENYMIHISPEGKYLKTRQVLNPNYFDKIKPGMPMEEVRKILGEPAKKMTYNMSKKTIYTWRYLDSNLSKLFEVEFDPDLAVIQTGSRDDDEGGGRN